MKIEEFASLMGLEIKVRERSRESRLPPYYASFERAEVMSNGCLVSMTGDGESPEAAIADYAAKISGERLAIDACTPRRREIVCPQFDTAARLTPAEVEVLRGLVKAVEPYTVGAPNAQSYPMTLVIEALPLIARLAGDRHAD